MPEGADATTHARNRCLACNRSWSRQNECVQHFRLFHDQEPVPGAIPKMTFRPIAPPTPGWVAPVAAAGRPAGARLGAGGLATPAASAPGTGTAAVVDPFAAAAAVDPGAGAGTADAGTSDTDAGPAPGPTPGSPSPPGRGISPATGELPPGATDRNAIGADPVFFAGNDSLNALVPYLALGFVPQYTRNTGNLCALYALATSLRAARNLNSTTPIPEAQHFTGPQLTAIFQGRNGSTEFQDKIEEVLRDGHHRSLDAATLAEHRRNYSAQGILDVQQIRIMLMILNDRMNTNYVLGYITQGYRGGYEKTAAFTATEVGKSADEIRRTPWVAANYVWNEDLHVNTNAVLFPDDGRSPVVWIWNDNFAAIALAQSGSVNSVGHWEGLAPIADPVGVRRVAGWGFEQRITDEVAVGIWRANRNTLMGLIASTGVDPVLRCGHFVREADHGAALAVPDRMFVRTCALPEHSPPGTPNQEGWVLNQDLTRVVITAPAPAAPPAPPASGSNESADAGGNTLNLTNSRDFTIFRGIPLTNKVGGPRNEHGAQFIDNFNFASGDFLLDNTRVDAHDVASVRAMDGTFGRAYRRHLQIVINPWGLGDRIPVITGSSTANATATLTNRGVALPLARVARNIPAAQPGDSFFLENEVVLLTGMTPDGRAMSVRDFESERGILPLDACLAIPNAFGLRLDADALNRRIDYLKRPARAAAPLGPTTARKRKADEVDIGPPARRVAVNADRGWLGCQVS